jgi:hypothetical protein
MAYIHTFYGDGDTLGQAIEKAEDAATDFLKDLKASEIVSVQAQTIATPWKTEAATDIKTEMIFEYIHVITVVTTVSEGTPGSGSREAPDIVNEPLRQDYGFSPGEGT